MTDVRRLDPLGFFGNRPAARLLLRRGIAGQLGIAPPPAAAAP